MKISTIEEGMNFWNNTIGLNIAPWDSKNKKAMVGEGAYLPWQTKPIPKEIMLHWVRNNKFDKGFQIYLGKIWHNGHCLTCIDLDNELALKEFCNFNGKQLTFEELS